jgi:hypothetical protein
MNDPSYAVPEDVSFVPSVGTEEVAKVDDESDVGLTLREVLLRRHRRAANRSTQWLPLDADVRVMLS